MNLRYLILGASALLLGFLFYPRGEKPVAHEQQTLAPVRTLDSELLHAPDIIRTDPVFATYDLGYVYKIDRARVLFENADENGPKQYDILVHTDKTHQLFNRVFAFNGSSREYTYTWQTFPFPVEARWVQVVVNDWFSNKPKIQSDGFLVGLRYRSHSPIQAVRTSHNEAEAEKLIDLLPVANAVWRGAERVENEVKGDDGKTSTAVSYNTPTEAIQVVGDLGAIQQIYGVRLTTDGPGNNTKRYRISVGNDSNSLRPVYVSEILSDDTTVDLHEFDPPLAGRYVRLRIDEGDWYGDYPEIRAFEVFTDSYRLPPRENERRLDDYNAVQFYYENLGEANNSFAPHLVAGFAFDRDTGDENRYFLLEGDEMDKVNAGHTPGQRSFAYHYDAVHIQYTNLAPAHLYWVQVTYLQEKGGERIQNLTADGFILHEAIPLPKGQAETQTYAIPDEAYADGELLLSFNRLFGPNAVVSEVSLFEARPATESQQRAARLRYRATGRAVQVSEPVVVDGRIDEWPLLYPMLPAGYRNQADAPVAVYAQWDADNLYIAALINRQAQATREDLKQQAWSNNETLHVFIDAALDRSPGMYNADDHHFVFTFLNTQGKQPRVHASQIHHHLDAIPRTIDNHKDIEPKVSKTATGYTLEARIPKDLALTSFQPEVGKSIGFNYVMADIKLADRKAHWFAYASTDLNASPISWQTMELANPVGAQIAFVDVQTGASIATFNIGDTLLLGVRDTDPNRRRDVVESIEAELRNDTTGQTLSLVLRESNLSALADEDPENDLAENTGFFAAKVPTVYQEAGVRGHESRTPDPGPRTPDPEPRLFVHGADEVSLTYIDAYHSSTQRNQQVRATVKANTGATGSIVIATESGTPLKQFRLGQPLYIHVTDADLPVPTPAATEPSTETQPTAPPDSGGAAAAGQDSGGTTPEIVVQVGVPESNEVERLTLTYDPANGRYIGVIPTVYGETAAPEDGTIQAVGAQAVEAIYLDKIQATGETNVPINTLAWIEIGDTAQLAFDQAVESIETIDDQKFFMAGTPLTVQLEDTDLNVNEAEEDKVIVTLEGNRLKDQYHLPLKETDVSSGVFVGVCPTRYATEADRDNDQIEVTGDERIIVSYVDAVQGSGATAMLVTDEAIARSGTDGVIEIVRVSAGAANAPLFVNRLPKLENFNAGDRLHFRVRDEDVSETFVEIQIVGELLADQETLRLFKSPESEGRVLPPGIFFNTIETAYSTQSQKGDGALQVQGLESVQAIYVDALRSTGETGVKVSDVCTTNVGTTGSLAVYNLRTFDPASDNNPEITWFRAGDSLLLEIRDADLSTTSAVAQLFETDFTDSTVRDNIRVTMVEVTGSAGIFRGKIETDYGETAILNDDILQVQGGGVVTFTYIDALQETGATQVSVQVQLAVETGDRGVLNLYSAERGKIISGFAVGTGSFNAGERLRIELSDDDLNRSATVIDTVTVAVSGNVLRDEVALVLRETATNTAIFEATLETQKATAITLLEDSATNGSVDRERLPETARDDNVLQITDKEVVSVVYADEITATGETGVEVVTQAVVLGSSAGLLRIIDREVTSPSLVAEHELGSFSPGATIYFWLEDLLLSTVVGATEVSITVTGDKTKDVVEVTLNQKLGQEGVFVGAVPTRFGTTPVADDTLDVQGDERVRAIYTPNFPNVNNPVVEDQTYTNKGNRGYLAITHKDGTPLRTFNIGASLYFRLADADLNTNPFAIESVVVDVRTPVQEIPVRLREENANSEVFRGEIATQHGRTVSDAGASIPEHVIASEARQSVLGLVGGETITVAYEDALIDTGETNVEISATCRANLIGRATYARTPVLIDGLEDSWPLENVLRTAEDEGLLWLQWDRDYLYVLAQIYDTHVVVPDVIEYYRGADALELHIDLQPEAVKKPIYLQTEQNPNRFVLWFCPVGGGFRGNQPYIGQGVPKFIPNYQAANFDVAVRQRSNYYTIETRIPLATVLRGFDPLKTKRNTRIGFNFVIHRSDDQAVYWATPLPDSSPVFPSDLGLVLLEGQPF